MTQNVGDLKKVVADVAQKMSRLNTSMGGAQAKFQSVASRAESVLSGSSPGVATRVAESVKKAQKAVTEAAESVRKAEQTSRTYSQNV
jgi:phage shock protein A